VSASIALRTATDISSKHGHPTRRTGFLLRFRWYDRKDWQARSAYPKYKNATSKCRPLYTTGSSSMFSARVFALLSSIALTFAYSHKNITSVCNEIAGAISSSSDVYWPGMCTGDNAITEHIVLSFSLHSGQDEYTKDIHHWGASSIEQYVCSVEPGTTEDIGKIVRRYLHTE
jgi:hypothetical protein